MLNLPGGGTLKLFFHPHPWGLDCQYARSTVDPPLEPPVIGCQTGVPAKWPSCGSLVDYTYLRELQIARGNHLLTTFRKVCPASVLQINIERCIKTGVPVKVWYKSLNLCSEDFRWHLSLLKTQYKKKMYILRTVNYLNFNFAWMQSTWQID